MNFDLIAKACKVPVENLKQNWLPISAFLRTTGNFSPEVCIAVLGTVAVETAWTFRAIREFGSQAYFTHHYESRADLGNDQPGDGAKYCGRGFVQITGKANYRHFGTVVGVDLVADPDQALHPQVAAAILVHYFIERKVMEAAKAKDWTHVRKLVNGGTNGLLAFLGVVSELEKIWQTEGEA